MGSLPSSLSQAVDPARQVYDLHRPVSSPMRNPPQAGREVSSGTSQSLTSPSRSVQTGPRFPTTRSVHDRRPFRRRENEAAQRTWQVRSAVTHRVSALLGLTSVPRYSLRMTSELPRRRSNYVGGCGPCPRLRQTPPGAPLLLAACIAAGQAWVAALPRLGRHSCVGTSLRYLTGDRKV